MDFIAYMNFYSNFKDNNENYRPSKNTLPNNWGRQDYDGRKFDVIIKPQIDTNNLSEKKRLDNCICRNSTTQHDTWQKQPIAKKETLP